jgi:site-specific DNA-methyltransferase (adenine-specific)
VREVIGTSRRHNSRPFGEGEGDADYGTYAGGVPDITAPATDLARQWDGWGTALKPAHEPIVLARKPLIGTVAANVAAHGTGAINVDGCRIEGAPETTRFDPAKHSHDGWRMDATGADCAERASTVAGRWPANVILDEEAAALLDAQSGERKAGGKVTGRQQSRTGQSGIYGHYEAKENSPYYDTGGASRFFYCAKASRAERNAGLAGMPERDDKLERYRLVKENPNTGKPNNTQATANVHPCVKPIALMRWLVRLITPPDGLILDPFLGSGTTGIASATEGFRFIGIEQDAEYLEIARHRIAHWTKAPDFGPLFAGMAAD